MGFHWLMAIIAFLMSLGGITDARQHIQHGFEIESFFVPSHYLLYAGWLLGGVALALYVSTQRRRGKPRAAWLPEGYLASVLGFLVFGLGGGVDLLWHEKYGFETNLEAPISPGHTLLVIGAGLMYSAVIFHGLHIRRRNPQKFSASLNRFNFPTLLSTISLLTAVLWPTWFLDPLLVDVPSGGVLAQGISSYQIFQYGTATADALGISGIFLMTLLTMPFVLLPLHRWRMPVGYVTLVVAGYTGLRALVGNAYPFLPATIGAAVVGDLIWFLMRRKGEAGVSSPTGYRLMAFLLPVVQYLLYFAIVASSLGSLTWNPHLWAGTAFTTGAYSFLMSYVLIRPRNQGIDQVLYRFHFLAE